MSDIYLYLAVFLCGLGTTLALTPMVRTLAVRVGAVDLPDQRRPHKRPTPRGGGLAVVLGVHAACFLALVLPWQSGTVELDGLWWRQFGLASFVLLVVGVIDDTRGLRPLWKLGGQVLAAYLISLSGLRFGKLFEMTLPPAVDTCLVIFWIVGVINAFNLIDGLDGLACGLAVIAAFGLGGALILGHVPGELIVLVGLIGACIGFLRYNFHPASVFLGDTGSMFLGFTLGVISLRTVSKDTFFLSLCIPMLVLGVPLYDEILAIWRRSVRAWLRRSQSQGTGRRMGIMQPDIEHLHHRLLQAGLSTRRVAGVLYAINAGLVLCGLLLTTFRSHAAGIFLIALLVGAYVLMRQLAVIELRDTGRVILNGLHRPTHATLQALVYPLWDMAVLAGAVALAMRMLDGPKAGFWNAWFLDLPVWVTPTFSLLAISRTYTTVWTRARVLDVIMLGSILLAGLVLSLGIALLIDPSNFWSEIFRAVVIGCISHPAIVVIRLFYRLTEESVTYLRNKSETDPKAGRLLLYGAGGRCQLFLKERGSINSRTFDGRAIVGLIDDDASLHTRWVYGYQVLGGLAQLLMLAPRLGVTHIIVTCKLRPDAASELEAVAVAHGIVVSEWYFGTRAVALDTSPKPLPAVSVASNEAVKASEAGPSVPGQNTNSALLTVAIPTPLIEAKDQPA